MYVTEYYLRLKKELGYYTCYNALLKARFYSIHVKPAEGASPSRQKVDLSSLGDRKGKRRGEHSF